jgi:hypothetical protein
MNKLGKPSRTACETVHTETTRAAPDYPACGIRTDRPSRRVVGDGG